MHRDTTLIWCCVRFGFLENPSSQPLLREAPRLEAASAQPDYRSGVKLKCTLQTFIHSYLELSVQLKSQDRCRVVMVAAFMWQCKVLARCVASASHSSAESASSGTQRLAQKLDCTRGKSQLFHTTLVRKRDSRGYFLPFVNIYFILIIIKQYVSVLVVLGKSQNKIAQQNGMQPTTRSLCCGEPPTNHSGSWPNFCLTQILTCSTTFHLGTFQPNPDPKKSAQWLRLSDTEVL